MSADPLDQILKLVAEGRLTADEAAPILAALDAPPTGAATPGREPGPGAPHRFPGAPHGFPAATHGVPGDAPPGGFGSAAPPSFDAPASDPLARATVLRLEVSENGRPVVNLRLPIAVGRLALDRVPGLSGEQVERAREAMSTGLRGPILQVEDGSNRVLITLE